MTGETNRYFDKFICQLLSEKAQETSRNYADLRSNMSMPTTGETDGKVARFAYLRNADGPMIVPFGRIVSLKEFCLILRNADDLKPVTIIALANRQVRVVIRGLA